MTTTPSLYRRHRFPPEIVGHAVYRYFRFALSHRAVEELLAVRGIAVSYATIRRWCDASLGLVFVNVSGIVAVTWS